MRVNATKRRGLYGKRMTVRTYAALARRALAEVRQQRGVVIEATFATRLQRDRIRENLQRAGVAFQFLETRASQTALKRRLAARDHSRTEVSDARLEDLPVLDRAFQSPVEMKPDEFSVISTARTPTEVIRAALKVLVLRRIKHMAGVS